MACTGQAELTRWHLEAGIAAEHALAATFAATNWTRIVALYDQLAARAGSPIVALGRAVAIAQLKGSDAGREALLPLAGDEKLARYHPYWAARAEIGRRGRVEVVDALAVGDVAEPEESARSPKSMVYRKPSLVPHASTFTLPGAFARRAAHSVPCWGLPLRIR